MIQTSTNRWLNKLALLYQAIPTNGNQEIKNKCIDFMQKIEDKELAIAFTGHFSAGKSSLMNDLFGISLLPTSPIPTSANVVRVKHGPDRIRFRYFDGSLKQVVGTYTEEAFQALCLDGDRATEVLIERLDVPLPPHIAIVDTPGVDSTDEAHRVATEANLHVSDVIFYMMDYNHVQAEGNLQFVKDLTIRGKQVYLIINQIDKHRDAELSFSSFQQGVANSFSAWGIKVAGIYFTSLKQPDHPHNQLQQVKSLLHNLYEKKDQLIEQNVMQEMKYLIQQFTEKQASSLPSKQSLGEQRQAFINNKIQLDQHQEQLQLEKKQITNHLMQDLDGILQNAYLMPADLREQAKNYLEAMQPDFKVGLWFSKNKTEHERTNREQQLLHSLIKTVSTQLTGHVKELVIQHAKKHHIFQDSMLEELSGNIPELTPVLLKQTIKQAAGLNGNYVLTYTNDLVEQIKTRYRAFVRVYVQKYLPQLEQGIQQTIQNSQQDLQFVEAKIQQTLRDLQFLIDLDNEQHRFLLILQENSEEIPHEIIAELLETNTSIQQTTIIAETKVIPIADKQRNAETAHASHTKQKQARLLEAENIMLSVAPLQPFLERLQAKRLQMESQQFTVALFGAFSAGKSSFANALLGQSILPVSPNPTTATVCRICPPNTKHEDGSATVSFKSKDTLQQELQHLFQLFQHDIQYATIQELIKDIPTLLGCKLETSRQKMAIPFLRAIQTGYEDLELLLGTNTSMTQAEAISYMANEAKSAFVEEVSLYADSILAKLGITLVDTPGADSLHARHTDVAFRYMKQADALLFVTYYNHAFSRADRELLIQLGRVQDSFALDKMYFIVNAADLAASQVELNKVVAYVESQLHQYGIRHPRMYPVSSLTSLEDKQQNRELNVPFAQFEKDFLTFIQEDSRIATTERMITDVEQAVSWIKEMLAALQKSESEKEAQQQLWLKAKETLVQQLSHLSSTTDEDRLAQEIKTLLYYVGERLRLRYYDEFVVYINPSTIRESGKNGRKQLATAATELLSFIGNDLIQEFRATSLRLERWIQTALSTFTEQENRDKQSHLFGLSLDIPVELILPTFTWDHPTWNEKNHHFEKAIAIYKSNQTFFEQDGRDRMREQLKIQLDEVLSTQITRLTEELTPFYISVWKQNIEKVAMMWKTQIADHFVRLQSSLQEQMEEQPLVDAKEKLEQLLLPIR